MSSLLIAAIRFCSLFRALLANVLYRGSEIACNSVVLDRLKQDLAEYIWRIYPVLHTV